MEEAIKLITVGAASLLFWLYRKNSRDLSEIKIDLAVIKEILERVSGDHDKLIILKDRQNRIVQDVNEIFKKIRNIGREL